MKGINEDWWEDNEHDKDVSIRSQESMTEDVEKFSNAWI